MQPSWFIAPHGVVQCGYAMEDILWYKSDRAAQYISTFSLPFDLINGIYANGRNLFIRLNSSSLFDHCLCNGGSVDFDVTEGERANALFHHIVLRKPAASFCAALSHLNEMYFSKVFQSFVDFSQDLNGVTTPKNLCCQAKLIVSQNSRFSAKLGRIREPYVKIRKKYTHSNEEVNPQNSQEPTVSAEIPDVATDSETPVLKLVSYRNCDFVEGFPGVLCRMSAASTSPPYGISSVEESQPFPNLYDIPLSDQESNCSSLAIKSLYEKPDEGGVPSLYAQPEYRSSKQELHCSFPVCTDQMDIAQLFSSYPNDDISAYLSSSEDTPLTGSADLARLGYFDS
ncbi:hypothetical protein ANCCAN_17355 [Ancylostoma caninum]|uniref:Uncharacterized protein n=1 Tax=Ancylostoma caninum TaxID=29170 RepID=A0A368FZ63_ANCCA|nr:hypothetical protein ANCCAN_17355 [Ancylostoma caninum]